MMLEVDCTCSLPGEVILHLYIAHVEEQIENGVEGIVEDVNGCFEGIVQRLETFLEG